MRNKDVLLLKKVKRTDIKSEAINDRTIFEYEEELYALEDDSRNLEEIVKYIQETRDQDLNSYLAYVEIMSDGRKRILNLTQTKDLRAGLLPSKY